MLTALALIVGTYLIGNVVVDRFCRKFEEEEV